MTNKIEANIIIVINCLRKIMQIFLGPFLTAYFIKISANSITTISIYYIFAFFMVGISTFIVAYLIKQKFRVGMFRIGVVLNFIYIMFILIFQENITNHLFLLATLYGISMGCYSLPYNLFVINKINKKYRIEYTVKLETSTELIAILFPAIFGAIITISNFKTTIFIILILSIIQIILSFILKSEPYNLSKLNLKRAWKAIKNNLNVRNCFWGEFLIGLTKCDGALEILMVMLILNSFKTNMNLGLLTSLATIASVVSLQLYGKIYNKKTDKKSLICFGYIPFLSLIVLLIFKSDITVIVYNFLYVVFIKLIFVAREIRLNNLSNSSIIGKENQLEFCAIREGILNIGRIIGYIILFVGGFLHNNIILNIIFIILTGSICALGLIIGKIEKFDK